MKQPSLGDTQIGDKIVVLDEAVHFIEQNEREKPSELSLSETQINDKDVEAWLVRADSADSPAEKLASLKRLYDLNHRDERVKQRIYAVLGDLLEQEPFLAYIEETEDLYRIRSGLEFEMDIPKFRAAPEPYPAPQPQVLKSAYRWLAISMAGLILGGIGASLFAPVAAFKAFSLRDKPLSQSERARSRAALAAAIMVWLVAIPIDVIFVLHILH